MGEVDDPVALARDYWALTKLWHAVDALYIWEFLTTLDYEWSVIRGRRPYRWTIWVYSLTRVATLVAVILNFIGLDAATSINCELWGTLNFVFAYLALACSSLLVVFRVIAIWNKNRFVVVLAACVWGTNVACLSEGISRIRSGWNTDQSNCVVLNMESNKPTIIVVFVTDIVLLLIMLVGLLRLRRHGGGTFELGRLLWKQGLVWLLIGTAAELTPVLFISLYLNDALNIMFLMPSLLAMSIAATRMYRSLTDFCSSVLVSDNNPKSDRTASAPSAKGSSSEPSTAPDPVAVNMNVAYIAEPYLMPQPIRNMSFLDMNDGALPDRSRGPSFDDDLESGRGKEMNTIAKPLLRK